MESHRSGTRSRGRNSQPPRAVTSVLPLSLFFCSLWSGAQFPPPPGNVLACAWPEGSSGVAVFVPSVQLSRLVGSKSRWCGICWWGSSRLVVVVWSGRVGSADLGGDGGMKSLIWEERREEEGACLSLCSPCPFLLLSLSLVFSSPQALLGRCREWRGWEGEQRTVG